MNNPCPNCQIFLSRCKAECCTMAPIERIIYYRNFDKMVTPVKELIELNAEQVLPVTESLKCTFLKDDFGCAIYNDRPKICKKYGDETHPMLTCAHQTKEGRERDPKTKEKLIRVQREKTKQMFSAQPNLFKSLEQTIRKK